MISWSWSGLLNIYQYGVPLILLLILAHLFAFLIFGLPMFFAFWKRKSIVWFLPVSLLLGLLIAAVFGFPGYYSGGYLSTSGLALDLGYGAITAVGCWLANRRSERVVAPHRPLPRPLNSPSTVRGPVDW